MKVTEVRITKLKEPMGKKIAFASVTIDDQLTIKSLEVIDNNGSVFVAFPARFNKEENKSYPYIYASPTLKKDIQDAILDQLDSKPKTVEQTFGADPIPTVPASVNLEEPLF